MGVRVQAQLSGGKLGARVPGTCRGEWESGYPSALLLVLQGLPCPFLHSPPALDPPTQGCGPLLQLIFTLLVASQDLGLARAHRKHWASEEMKSL